MLFTLLSNLPGMAYRCRDDRDWTMEFVSEGCHELTGYYPSDLLENRVISYAELIHPDDREAVWEDVQAALKYRKPFQLQYRIINKSGAEKWVWEQGRGVYGREGRLEALEGFIADITERKQSEKLQDALFRIARAPEKCSSLDELFSLVHKIIAGVMPANNFYIALYDKEQELLSFPYFVDSVDSPPEPRRLRKGFTEYVLRSGNSLLGNPVAQAQLTASGELEALGAPAQVWLGVPLKVEHNTIGVMAVQHYSDPGAYTEREKQILEYVSSQVARAIERKRTEEALKESLSLLSATLDSTADGILVVNLQGKIVSYNQRFVRMWRIPEDVMASKDDDRALAFVLNQLKQPEAFLSKVKELYGHPEAESCDLLEFKDGRVFERYSQPQRLGGKITGRVWSFRDITERRNMEEQLRQSLKMDAIGRLAGGVAHDFNNLLTIILGRTEMLNKKVESESPLYKDIELIEKASERGAALTSQLLAFSRRQPLEVKVISLNAIVLEIESMLRRVIGDSVELKIRLKPELGLTKCDPNQMEQVIMNLIVNARDAMPKGGNITVETDNVELDEAYARRHTGARPGAYVMLSVSDTGSGMDHETKAHLFEPFFTTKDKGKGTGLGLSTVYGIVKQSRGNIWVYSELGKGSTFKIYLPRVESSGEVARPSEPENRLTDVAPAQETVLLVEDEEEVRSLARTMLETAGYTVLEAGNGQEALKVSSQYGGHIHLLLTDVIMPKMSGPELSTRLLELRSDIKVLYMSGYTGDAIASLGVLDAGCPFIQKPFTAHGLTGKVLEVLRTQGLGQIKK